MHGTLDWCSIIIQFSSDAEFANALNCFYNRFDTFYFKCVIQDLRHKLEDDKHFEKDLKKVVQAFLSVNVNKSHGLDNILNPCEDHLKGVVCSSSL